MSATVGIVVQTFMFSAPGLGYSQWTSITVAFIACADVESPSYSVSLHRLVGTLVGAMAALFIVRFSQGSAAALGTLVAAFVALMQYHRPNYWATVAAFTAGIIAFQSVNPAVVQIGSSLQNADSLLELRVIYTVLGILAYVAVSHIVFPLPARTLLQRNVVKSLRAVRMAHRQASEAFATAVAEHATAGGAPAEAVTAACSALAPAAPSDAGVTSLSLCLDAAEGKLAGLPALVAEIAVEPIAGFAAPFRRVRAPYEALATQLGRVCRSVRTLQQCLLCLQRLGPRRVHSAAAQVNEGNACVGSDPHPDPDPAGCPHSRRKLLLRSLAEAVDLVFARADAALAEEWEAPALLAALGQQAGMDAAAPALTQQCAGRLAAAAAEAVVPHLRAFLEGLSPPPAADYGDATDDGIEAALAKSAGVLAIKQLASAASEIGSLAHRIRHAQGGAFGLG